MAELGLQALHRRVAGIDVHRMLHVVTVLSAGRAEGRSFLRACKSALLVTTGAKVTPPPRAQKN